MRDDDHRAVAVVEHVLEPADGVDVEVVGRLVEQQDVGVGEQRLGEQHAQLPARGDLAHRAVVQLGGDAHAEQQLAGARLGGVAVVFADLALELGGVHVVVLGGVRVGVDRVALLDRRPQLLVAHHHHVEHAHVFIRELVLAQVGHALVRILGDVAGARVEDAAQDLHERRLAGAVGADQAVAVAVAELDGDVLEQGLGPELLGDVGCDEHGSVLKIR